MKRVIETDDLVGAAEIAERVGVTKGAVINWRARYEDFPPPLAALNCGPVYYWGDIAKWLASTGRA